MPKGKKKPQKQRYSRPGPVSNRLREWRLRRGLNQSQLARMAGIDSQTVCRIEQRKVALTGGYTLPRLAKALGCSESELVGFTGPDPLFTFEDLVRVAEAALAAGAADART